MLTSASAVWLVIALTLLSSHVHCEDRSHIFGNLKLKDFSVATEVSLVNPERESLSKYSQEYDVILIVNIATNGDFVERNLAGLEYLQKKYSGKEEHDDPFL